MWRRRWGDVVQGWSERQPGGGAGVVGGPPAAGGRRPASGGPPGGGAGVVGGPPAAGGRRPASGGPWMGRSEARAGRSPDGRRAGGPPGGGAGLAGGPPAAGGRRPASGGSWRGRREPWEGGGVMSVLALPKPVLDFVLPPELEATAPAEVRGRGRDDVRLLASWKSGSDLRIEHHRFTELPQLLNPGDLVVVNTSGTLPAAVTATLWD